MTVCFLLMCCKVQMCFCVGGLGKATKLRLSRPLVKDSYHLSISLKVNHPWVTFSLPHLVWVRLRASPSSHLSEASLIITLKRWQYQHPLLHKFCVITEGSTINSVLFSVLASNDYINKIIEMKWFLCLDSVILEHYNIMYLLFV